MVQTIEIENFQSHKSSSLALHPGVNIIVGSSDSGKSAIVRALKWLFFNRPSGESFRSSFANKEDTVRVAVEFDDGYVIKSRKGTENQYETEEDVYRAIRSDVPDEVTKVTKIDEINFQSQAQPYFLLDDTPGDVAKKLNKIVGLDVIDTLFANLQSKIKNTQYEIKLTEQSIEKEQYIVQTEGKDIATLGPLVKTLDNLLASYRKLADQSNVLDQTITSLLKLDQSKALQRKVLLKENSAQELTLLLREYKDLMDSLNLVKTVLDLHERIHAEEDWLEIEEPIEEIKSYFAEHSKAIGFLKEVTNYIEQWKARLFKAEDVKTKKDRLGAILSQHKICPLCNNKITVAQVKKIVEGL